MKMKFTTALLALVCCVGRLLRNPKTLNSGLAIGKAL